MSEWVTGCLIQLFSYFTQLRSYNFLINNNRNFHGCVTNIKTGLRSNKLLSIPTISQCLRPSSKIHIYEVRSVRWRYSNFLGVERCRESRIRCWVKNVLWRCPHVQAIPCTGWEIECKPVSWDTCVPVTLLTCLFRKWSRLSGCHSCRLFLGPQVQI